MVFPVQRLIWRLRVVPAMTKKRIYKQNRSRTCNSTVYSYSKKENWLVTLTALRKYPGCRPESIHNRRPHFSRGDSLPTIRPKLRCRNYLGSHQLSLLFLLMRLLEEQPSSLLLALLISEGKYLVVMPATLVDVWCSSSSSRTHPSDYSRGDGNRKYMSARKLMLLLEATAGRLKRQ